MADFCSQCSLDTFGEDYGDLIPEGSGPLMPGCGYLKMCEGCGFILVNENGECIATRAEGCLKGHGGGEVQ